MSARGENLVHALGYHFTDAGLIRQALTHRSAGRDNYERLEFLGDAVLNLVMAEELFNRCPGLPEGELSRVRSQFVCQERLAERARAIGLGEHIVLGEGEIRSGGHDRDSILADALEAVFGAIFRDGGFSAARAVILAVYGHALAGLDPAQIEKDPKTRLQEFLQKRGRLKPVYETVGISGDPHRQRFTVECRVEGEPDLARGEGASRRQAEQDAAAKMCERFGV
ncbi:MAG: ribonuclease III [Acidiferrobacteraceae bacterium]